MGLFIEFFTFCDVLLLLSQFAVVLFALLLQDVLLSGMLMVKLEVSIVTLWNSFGNLYNMLLLYLLYFLGFGSGDRDVIFRLFLVVEMLLTDGIHELLPLLFLFLQLRIFVTIL